MVYRTAVHIKATCQSFYICTVLCWFGNTGTQFNDFSLHLFLQDSDAKNKTEH